jgi:hypothetical protein
VLFSIVTTEGTWLNTDQIHILIIFRRGILLLWVIIPGTGIKYGWKFQRALDDLKVPVDCSAISY